MALVIASIKGQMGDTTFYEATMPARELITGVRPASELDTWASMGIEERMQRDPDTKRIMNEIAPYIAKSKDRFFGAVIVLVYKGRIEFESLEELITGKLPFAYRSVGNRIGFITIDGGSLIVLDGQHRLLSLEKVVKNEVKGPYSQEVPGDDISVIFIQHENDEKTRRIFNKVNRYAKATSRGDNIITSEDDGYAIMSRWMLRDGAPLGNLDGREIVNWKSNTLSPRSIMLTTISAVYETIKIILAAEGIKLDEKERPTDEKLEQHFHQVEHFWQKVIDGLEPYQAALHNVTGIPQMREDTASYSLLFKPVVQIALFKALIIATVGGRLTVEEAIKRANHVNWQMSSDAWKDIIVRQRGAIDTTAAARETTGQVIAYLIAADVMPQEEIDAIHAETARIRGYSAALPSPVVPAAV